MITIVRRTFQCRGFAFVSGAHEMSTVVAPSRPCTYLIHFGLDDQDRPHQDQARLCCKTHVPRRRILIGLGAFFSARDCC